jgi:hypothetical protein
MPAQKMNVILCKEGPIYQSTREIFNDDGSSGKQIGIKITIGNLSFIEIFLKINGQRAKKEREMVTTEPLFRYRHVLH